MQLTSKMLSRSSTSEIFDTIATAEKLGIRFNNLTKAVIIGDQSSGKTSLVESLYEADLLPKKAGLASKKPANITLVNGDTLRFFVEDEEFSDQALAKAKISRINNTHVNSTINIKVVSPNVHNMSFIDTPGLARFTQEGVDHKETKKLIQKYLEDKNNIIIVVASAATDIATCQALQMVYKARREKDCIGILTKMDLVETQAKTTIYNMLEGKTKYSIGYGWGCVRLRNDAEINEGKTVSDCISVEKQYFAKISLPMNFNAGVPKIREIISSIQLMRFVKDFPRVIGEIDSKIVTLANSKTFLEKIMSDPQENLVDKLVNIFKKLVESSLERTKLDTKLRNSIRQGLIDHMDRIYGYKQISKVIPQRSIEYINTNIHDYHCTNKTRVSNISGNELQNIFSDGSLYQMDPQSDFAQAYKNESDLALMYQFFDMNSRIDPTKKKEWISYLEKYFNILHNDNTLQNLVYDITEKLIIDHITESDLDDEVTMQFTKYLIKEIGNKAYEANIKFNINNLIKIEESPNLNMLEIIRELVQIIDPTQIEVSSGIFGRYNATKIKIDMYGELFNTAYLRSVINNIAINCFRIIEVNLIKKMINELLTIALSLNKENAYKENEEINMKINILESLKGILYRFMHSESMTTGVNRRTFSHDSSSSSQQPSMGYSVNSTLSQLEPSQQVSQLEPSQQVFQSVPQDGYIVNDNTDYQQYQSSYDSYYSQ